MKTVTDLKIYLIKRVMASGCGAKLQRERNKEEGAGLTNKTTRCRNELQISSRYNLSARRRLLGLMDQVALVGGNCGRANFSIAESGSNITEING